MRFLLPAFLPLAISACGGASTSPRVADVEPASSSSPSSTPSSSAASSSAPPSPNEPPPTDACVENADARKTCATRGPGFHYGARPYIYCSGIAPRPGHIEAAQDAIRRSPCECVDEAAVQRQRETCSRVPSAPPRPTPP